jgi:branched-chain amino acid transport system substrate-binding protein
MTSRLSGTVAAALLGLTALTAPAAAQELVVGITISTTGPAAALGIPERNVVEFAPAEIGGVKIKTVLLDDAGDPTTATTNARRLLTESKADILIGSSTTPPTIAVSTVANEAAVPHFALAPMPFTPAREKWTVVMPQPVPIVGKVLYEHMKKNNVKTIGYIGFSDSYGDLWLNDL